MALDLCIGMSIDSGGPVRFSPATLFPASGAWFDPSDLTTLFQDSAGTTPVTADGQPVGLMRDKSGNGNHMSQATAGKRPLYKTSGGLSWLLFDGVDDGLTTGAGTLAASSDAYVGIGNPSNDTSFLTLFHGSPSPYVGVAVSGDVGVNSGAAGTPANFVNGVALSPDTRAGLYTALGTTPKVFEADGIDATAGPWTTLRVGDYVGFEFGGTIYGILFVPAQSAANRAKIRTYLGSKAGLVL
jgi:hypothetical protein